MRNCWTQTHQTAMHPVKLFVTPSGDKISLIMQL